MGQKETDIQFGDTVVEGSPPREPHAGDRGGGSKPGSSAKPAQSSAPLFPPSNWIVGTFLSFSSSFAGTGVEVQVGQYAELDLINGYMSTGDFTTASVTRDAGKSAGMGGGISLGFFGGLGTAGGMSGHGSGANLGVAGPLGGGSIGYNRSAPDAYGNSGYSGVTGALNWSPAESAGSSLSVGDTKVQPREVHNLNIEKHIVDWMNANARAY